MTKIMIIKPEMPLPSNKNPWITLFSKWFNYRKGNEAVKAIKQPVVNVYSEWCSLHFQQLKLPLFHIQERHHLEPTQ